MTWVKGTTTWGNLAQDLNRLITGEIADASAVTVASGDRWVREQTRTVTDGVLNSTTTLTSATASFTAADTGSRVFGTGIPSNTTISSVTNSTTVVMSAAATASASSVTVQICTDALRTPAALDVSTGSMSNRTGYFALTTSSNVNLPGAIASVARVSSPYTSTPSSTTFGRWVANIQVSTVNTVAGNYSTAVISYQVWDADSGTFLANNTFSPTSGGVVTLANGLQITVSDPSGFLTLSTVWRRGFTTTYTYGIDYWPWYSRRTAAATFSVAPPGVSGTDYDIVSQAPGAGNLFSGERNAYFVGLGIKTATGLGTGALYTLSFPMAYMKGRIFPTGTLTGVLGLDVGPNIVDTVNGNVFRVVNGIRSNGFIRPFQTPTSVTSTAAVQYWLSVKATGICIALQGDPGFSGKLTTAYFGDFTPYDLTYDVFPIMFSSNQIDYTGDNSGSDAQMTYEHGYFRVRRSLDGSEGSRDWQTKWMRSDFGTAATEYYHGSESDFAANNTNFSLVACGFSTNPVSVQYGYAPARQTKPVPIDGKWWFYGFQWADLNPVSNGGSVIEYKMIRGYTNSRFLFLPGEGWGNGDELTDTSTSQKYLLLTPDYSGIAGRMRTTTNTFFGGVAIAEL